MPDEDEGGEDGGEKLVEQVDRRVGKQQAQLIHNLGQRWHIKPGLKPLGRNLRKKTVRLERS